MTERRNILNEVLATDEDGILQKWIANQVESPSFRSDRITRTELTEHSRRFLGLVRQAAASGSTDIESPAWANARQLLEELSVSRAQQGFSPSRDRDLRVLAQGRLVRGGARPHGEQPAGHGGEPCRT